MRIVTASAVSAGKVRIFIRIMTVGTGRDDVLCWRVLLMTIKTGKLFQVCPATSVQVGNHLRMTTATECGLERRRKFNWQRPMLIMTLNTIIRLHPGCMPLVTVKTGRRFCVLLVTLIAIQLFSVRRRPDFQHGKHIAMTVGTERSNIFETGQVDQHGSMGIVTLATVIAAEMLLILASMTSGTIDRDSIPRRMSLMTV